MPKAVDDDPGAMALLVLCGGTPTTSNDDQARYDTLMEKAQAVIALAEQSPAMYTRALIAFDMLLSSGDDVEKRPRPFVQDDVEKPSRPFVQEEVENGPRPLVQDDVENCPRPLVQGDVENCPRPLFQAEVGGKVRKRQCSMCRLKGVVAFGHRARSRKCPFSAASPTATHGGDNNGEEDPYRESDGDRADDDDERYGRFIPDVDDNIADLSWSGQAG